MHTFVWIYTLFIYHYKQFNNIFIIKLSVEIKFKFKLNLLLRNKCAGLSQMLYVHQSLRGNVGLVIV